MSDVETVLLLLFAFIFAIVASTYKITFGCVDTVTHISSEQASDGIHCETFQTMKLEPTDNGYVRTCTCDF